MKEYYNLFGPYESVMADIESAPKDDITILSVARNSVKGLNFFLIETTEETATFLSLKYGKDNIWKR